MNRQPVAGGGRRAGVAGAGDLVDGLEHHTCSGGAGDFRRAVGGIVIADDQFALPSRARQTPWPRC